MSIEKSVKSKLKLTPEEQTLFDSIDKKRIPRHIAIIMDGNGRWARSRNKSRIKGHKAAIPAVQDTVESCADLGVKHLTVYAFSTENWKRPVQETGTLMALLRQYLRLGRKSAMQHQIKVNVLGTIEALAPGIQKDLRTVKEESKNNPGMVFNIALNYSGRNDILHAFKAAVRQGIDVDNLTEAQFGAFLSTHGQPDPDLVIRTSGELRISNFLLWQIAYSEIVVTPTLWPDFRKSHLYQAVVDYQSRHRRFGGI